MNRSKFIPELTAEKRKKHSADSIALGDVSDSESAVNPNATVRPITGSHVPEITWQSLLDTSDSESEKAGSTRTKPQVEIRSGFSPVPEESRFPLQSPVSFSQSQTIGSRANPGYQRGKRSAAPGLVEKPRFIPLPVTHRSGSGSSNSKSESGSSPRFSPISDHVSASHRSQNSINISDISDAESSGSSISLRKPCFTYKTSSNVFGPTGRSLRGTGSSDHGRHDLEPRNSSVRSGTAHVANFDDLVGSRCRSFDSQRKPNVNRYPGRRDFVLPGPSSSSQMSGPSTSNLDVLPDIDKARKLGTNDSRPRDVGSGNVLPTSQAAAATIKLEPEWEPVISEDPHLASDAPRSRVSQSHESGKAMANLLPQASSIQYEQDVTGICEMESTDLRNLPVSSITSTRHQTPTNPVGQTNRNFLRGDGSSNDDSAGIAPSIRSFAQSNQSYSRLNVGSSNNDSNFMAFDSTSSHVQAQSNQSYLRVNVGTSNDSAEVGPYNHRMDVASISSVAQSNHSYLRLNVGSSNENSTRAGRAKYMAIDPTSSHVQAQSNQSHLRVTVGASNDSAGVGPYNRMDVDSISPVAQSSQSYLRLNVGSSNDDSTRLGRSNHMAIDSTSSHVQAQSNQSHLRVSVGTSNDSAGVGTYNRMEVDSSDQEHGINPPDAGTVIMSLVHMKNKIAGSCYNSSTGQIHLLESISDNAEFRTAVLALRSAAPSIVVVPSSGATRFVKELKTQLDGDVNLAECLFQRLSPRYFAYGFARRTVLESSLWEGSLTFRSEDAKKNAIVSNINLNDERLVCAFGGLLYYLSSGTPQLGAGMSPSPITSVQHMKLNNKLWVDTESFKNLQIFDLTEHPSSFNWTTANRDDGKSIFSLFERFCSPVGMTKLRAFLANPVNCRRVLEQRHEVINFYLNHSNFNAVEALRSFSSQMSSSSVVMRYLSSPTLRGSHWKIIYRHIYYTVSYAEVCRSHGAQSELFRELGSTIVDAVYSMAHNLERVVDLVNMENNETFVIKYGFHPPLDAAKEKFSRLKVAMDKVTPYEFDAVPAFITRLQMMYIPEMKFLLSIPYWAPDLSKEDLHLPNLEFKFTANKTAFYKSRRCYELDELLGDPQTDIINEESMIIQSLRNYLKKHMHHILVMAQKISEIECIFALAKVAREERYSQPEIVDSYVINIRGGWHPLLDVPSTQFITNDLVSSSDTTLVKLIYGPNASGKSIYLKQVGLIMYLVHVGSFVPAASAKVGLLGRILARTTKEESLISMSSTMLSELKKLQDSVMDCSKDSLIILDEVGKGSTEVNSIAIVTSALNYFLAHGSSSPHVLVSTHLSGISDFVTSPPHSDEGRNLFETLLMDYTVTDGEIVFLYKIRRGRPDGSFVFEVLEKSEFAAPIVRTARAVLEALRTGENFLPYCETRIQRSHKYLNFIRKFVNIDMAKPGYLEKLQDKIQRYYEKPKYQ